MKNSILFLAIVFCLTMGTAQEKSRDIPSKSSSTANKMKSSEVVSDNATPQDQADISMEKRIQDLEKRIEKLQAQLDDQNTKSRLAFMQISSNPMNNSTFEDFVFASDEFWKNPVDVGFAECSKSCGKAAKKRRDSCAKMGDGQGKIDCYDASRASASKCQKSCRELHPFKG
ncbi:hypothetical protein FGM00_15435 [Aggregatimonas sangjinii]|uniref:Uncharacterized protein n=1 Tax=Aggregatimonas sangjinii TaxID=2583587 RepID=A0A5B7SWV2_9FLAO|nr:hypothetical protein [Aggregatimonas sangjinii]QCX01431.1 hypothetical protein FGM00_15435 [Aggregatimonas sangjinii]